MNDDFPFDCTSGQVKVKFCQFNILILSVLNNLKK